MRFDTAFADGKALDLSLTGHVASPLNRPLRQRNERAISFVNQAIEVFVRNAFSDCALQKTLLPVAFGKFLLFVRVVYIRRHTSTYPFQTESPSSPDSVFASSWIAYPCVVLYGLVSSEQNTSYHELLIQRPHERRGLLPSICNLAWRLR